MYILSDLHSGYDTLYMIIWPIQPHSIYLIMAMSMGKVMLGDTDEATPPFLRYCRRQSTGLLRAAFTARPATVSAAISMAVMPTKAYPHHTCGTRKV